MIVYTWPDDTEKQLLKEGKSCYNCEYAVITLIAECSKKIDNEYAQQGGFCPSHLVCKHWKQASDDQIEINSFDWSQAIGIKVD